MRSLLATITLLSLLSPARPLLLSRPLHHPFLSSRFSSNWEAMYSNQDNNDNELSSLPLTYVNEAIPGNAPTPLRCITFDLDDTLWETSPIIKHANNILQAHLNRTLLSPPPPIYTIMKQLYLATPTLYYSKNIFPPSSPPPPDPVNLTLLRKHAIAHVASGTNYVTPETEIAFDVWFKARHTSIPEHLAPTVLTTLKHLRDKYPDLVIGAITNGNGDPKNVEVLSEFFDFCVNSEQVGVAKPHPEIYKASLSTITSLLPALAPCSQNGWWCHVGDDMLKDCVAAKEFGCKTVLTREFKLMKDARVGSSDETGVHVGVTEEDRLGALMSQVNDIRMQIGADDYLESSMQEKFCDAVVDTFEGIIPLIDRWMKTD